MPEFEFLTKMDTVAEWLRVQILNGSLRPGTQLLQRDIAQRLGMSPTPVREAFGVLESEGFVQRRPHRGVVVAERAFGAIEESYELRAVLEAWAIRHIAPRIDAATLAALEQANAASARALRRPDIPAFRRTASEFHAILVRATGSATLVEIVNLLHTRSLFYPPLDKESMTRVQRDHKRIAALLRRHDAATAVGLFERHMDWNIRLAGKAKPRRRRATGGAIAAT